MWTIIFILIVLWLLGFSGPKVFTGFHKLGNADHPLIIMALSVVALHLLGLV